MDGLVCALCARKDVEFSSVAQLWVNILDSNCRFKLVFKKHFESHHSASDSSTQNISLYACQFCTRAFHTKNGLFEHHCEAFNNFALLYTNQILDWLQVSNLYIF